MTKTKACCGTSVGVLIRDTERLLLIERATPPAGWAPVAGHALDEHPDPVTAARTEVAEEVGLRAGRLHRVYHRWLANRCRRAPAAAPPWAAPGTPPGHDWEVYAALDWDGTLAPSAREARGARWVTASEVQELAERTISYATGHLAEESYTTSPGLEPVWVDILRDLGLVRAEPAAVAAVEWLYADTARVLPAVWATVDAPAAVMAPLAALTRSWHQAPAGEAGHE